MGSSVKHLIPLPKDIKAEPAWAGELKDLLSRLVDLAASLVSSHKRGLVLEKILTPEELSERLKLPLSSIYEAALSGRLPAFRVGKHWRFDLDVLKKALDKEEI